MERVDDEPAHGEVPGTEAYEMRTADATPDEFEVIPESPDLLERSQPTTEETEETTGQPLVPKTVVELVDPDTPSHGDVPGTAAHEMRKADAVPDVVVKAPEESNGA